MRRAFRILALATVAAGVGATAALAAPGNKNTGEWDFNCGNSGTFWAVKSNSAGTSFHIEGTNTNFVIKTFTDTSTNQTFVNKGWDNNQNSGELITCWTQSPFSPFDSYSMTGAISPSNNT